MAEDTLECLNPSITFRLSTSSPCHIPAPVFNDVMYNLIKNPNITSSHLFRAEIKYDSANDATYRPAIASPVHASDAYQLPNDAELCGLAKHMQARFKPRVLSIRGFELQRTIVRELIPRNPKLDKPLAQTCHFYESILEVEDGDEENIRDDEASQGIADDDPDLEHKETLIVYLPHVESADSIPWYHPKVASLAFLHRWRPPEGRSAELVDDFGDGEHAINQLESANISLHVAPFSPVVRLEVPPTGSDKSEQDSRLARTLQNLLQTIIKHGNGLLAGYQKRVHHDQLVPQARFQNTYTRLKLIYAKGLTSDWREATDPTKHVFEDLSIAAFLMELWRNMYSFDTDSATDSNASVQVSPQTVNIDALHTSIESSPHLTSNSSSNSLPNFPGFVDIGCGNGLLVHILISEGYHGFGFDVRRRKSWAGYPTQVQSQLHEMILVPSVFESQSPIGPDAHHTGVSETDMPKDDAKMKTHNGIFPRGTFIISNHADELTTWTPLLARLSGGCPFLAIPCCSHDLSGVRTRFSAQQAGVGGGAATAVEPTQATTDDAGQLARTGTRSLSAYSTLCSYTERIAGLAGYSTKREMLRIPSTRNVGIVGTSVDPGSEHALVEPASGMNSTEAAEFSATATVLEILRSEMSGRSIDDLAATWWARAQKIRRSKGAGH